MSGSKWRVASADSLLVLVDPDEQFSAVIKPDGCVEVRRFHNGAYQGDPTPWIGMDDVDYIHICDLDDFIERLQAVKRTQDLFAPTPRFANILGF